MTNASRALSRLMRKTIQGRKVEPKREESLSVDEASDSCQYTYNVQVEISNHRHSAGSDKYSVVGNCNDNNNNNNNNSYAIIDMTEPEPVVRAQPEMTEPEGLQLRVRPDIIRDLPGSSRQVVRSSSFLSPGVDHNTRPRLRGVQRSVSHVTARPVCGLRAVRGRRESWATTTLQTTLPTPRHQRQGSVSSTSSGSLGSSSFVSPNRCKTSKPYISLNCPVSKQYHSPNLPTLPSSNSAFRRPKPVNSKTRELEQYASQWQHRGCRRSSSLKLSSVQHFISRNTRDLNTRLSSEAILQGETKGEDVYSSDFSSRSTTLPRKLGIRKQDDIHSSDCSQQNIRQHYNSLPRSKTPKVL